MDSTMGRLAKAVAEHSGMGRDEIVGVMGGPGMGADAGYPGFTYTADGAEFYRANSDDIDELLQEDSGSMGCESVAEFIGTFGRADMADTRDGRDCLLSWYALECVSMWLGEQDDDMSDEDEL